MQIDPSAAITNHQKFVGLRAGNIQIFSPGTPATASVLKIDSRSCADGLARYDL
jgi:hypothetical protein